MEALINMLKNVLIFILLAMPGFLLVKTKILKENHTEAFSKLLTNVGIPFMILYSTLNVPFSASTVKYILFISAFSIAFTIFTFFITALLTKKDKNVNRRRMTRFAMFFSNNGFLGIPLAQAVFGSDSMVLTYLIAINIITNVLLFTLGTYLISGDKKNINVKKVFLNPVIIAFFLGIVLNLLKVKIHVPEIAKFSGYFNNIVPPLSMIVLGMKMAQVSPKRIFTNPSTYYVSFVKLVLFPVLGVAILMLLRLAFNFSSYLIVSFFIGFAVPTAGLATVFSDQYNGDTESAVCYTLGTTLLSLITRHQ